MAQSPRSPEAPQTAAREQNSEAPPITSPDRGAALLLTNSESHFDPTAVLAADRHWQLQLTLQGHDSFPALACIGPNPAKSTQVL